MAKVDIKLISIQARADTGATLLISDSQPVDEEIMTSSGASQQSTIVVGARDYRAWMIKPIGGAIRVKFGDDPTADNLSGWHVSDGERLYVGVSASGEKVAVIDAS